MPLLQHHRRNKLDSFGVRLGSRKQRIYGNNAPNFMEPPKPQRNNGGFIRYGFNILGISRGPERFNGGPGYEDPPEGMLRGTTSMTEWYIYWALLKLLGPEGDRWVFQQSVLGGRHGPGGAVLDFVVYWRNIAYALRIQTYRFHIAAGPIKQGYDHRQLVDISTPQLKVIDIYEEDFIGDPTGKAAIRVTLEALNGQYMISPIVTGRAFGLG